MSGFNSIDGATVDAAGNVYFIDARFQRIYRWSPENRDVTLVRDSPLEPVGLAFDKSGDLLVVTRLNKVYSFRMDAPGDEIAALQPDRGRDSYRFSRSTVGAMRTTSSRSTRSQHRCTSCRPTAPLSFP